MMPQVHAVTGIAIDDVNLALESLAWPPKWPASRRRGALEPVMTSLLRDGLFHPLFRVGGILGRHAEQVKIGQSDVHVDFVVERTPGADAMRIFPRVWLREREQLLDTWRHSHHSPQIPSAPLRERGRAANKSRNTKSASHIAPSGSCSHSIP